MPMALRRKRRTRLTVECGPSRAPSRLLSQFLKEKRLEKAARLLKNGNLRVSQIARRCGFDSENYFRQQLRQRFGMSPRQLRTNGTLRTQRRPAMAMA